MDQIKHEIALEEVQFQYFMNTLANESPSSAPYISYDHLSNTQTTMGADAYQLYDTPDPYSYPAPSTSLSSSMPPNNHYDECYMGDQFTSDTLAQTVSQHLGAIPNIPPAANGDHYDENGDFFGRGKDTFVGPKANRDE